MSDAQHVRKTILAARDRLDPGEISAWSEAIRRRLLASGEINDAATICSYVSFRSEAQTLPLIESLLARGKRVVVPLTRVSERRLDLVAINDPANDLVPGYCNIPEPRESLLPGHLVDPQDLDLIILPGSVFDLRGGRFGYGGGYYDRLLAQVPGAGRIALAYELQVVERLPLAKHDELLDRIVTEMRIIKANRRR
jgi:5-formyltetrahydrofolate cyclo-ligase